MRSFIRSVAIIVSMELAVVSCAVGQAPVGEKDQQHAARCRAAASTTATQHSGTDLIMAIDRLRLCETTGGPALAAIWKRRPDNAEVVDRLIARSKDVHDRRLLETVIDAASDDAATHELRIGAMEVMASYVTGRASRLKVFQGRTGYGRFALMQSVHSRHIEGAEPLGPGHTQRILDALKSIAVSASHDDVKSAAEFLHSELQRRSNNR